MFQTTSPTLSRPKENDEPWLNANSASAHLTHITKIHDTGKVDLQVYLYLPSIPFPTNQGWERLQVKVGYRGWQGLHPSPQYSGYWSLAIAHVSPGTSLRFRYRHSSQSPWQPLTPLTMMERVYETTYVPDLDYQWRHQPPSFCHGRVLMETTLEGLLAGYLGGVLAPRSREEMFRTPIVAQILKTDIPGVLSEWEIDELMVPTNSSVADRANLNHKFNYLTYDVADIDWQLGQTHHFKKLVDQLYAYGISIVPDLSFIHQVSEPFAGSLDQIVEPETQKKIFVDPAPFQLRNYGTWLFRLEDPEVRRQLIEKVVCLVARYHLKMIRLDYLDGLILQYSNRRINFGAMFLQELKAAIKVVEPEVRILGETFEVSEHPIIQGCIDIFYAPFGFSVIEELCKPPSQRQRPLFPELERLIRDFNYVTQNGKRNALYGQLHDEICSDEHITAGRSRVPWAYGKNPAQLAKNGGEELVELGLLAPNQLLNYVHHTVRNAEALSLFTANLLYMFVPAVDSLALQGLENSDNWKVQWKSPSPQQVETWKKTDLSEAEIRIIHQKHRQQMVQLRRIFRHYTPVKEGLHPLIQTKICHLDGENSIIGLLRYNTEMPSQGILVLFNLGANSFVGHPYTYEFPLPHQWDQPWQILFDGDWSTTPSVQSTDSQAYEAGTLLSPMQGHFLLDLKILNLRLSARNLLILKYCASSN